MYVYAKMEPINSNNWTEQPALDLFSVDYFDSGNDDNKITGKYWRAKYYTTANQFNDKFCSNSNFEREMQMEDGRKWGTGNEGMGIEMCWMRANTNEKFLKANLFHLFIANSVGIFL